MVSISRNLVYLYVWCKNEKCECSIFLNTKIVNQEAFVFSSLNWDLKMLVFEKGNNWSTRSRPFLYKEESQQQSQPHTYEHNCLKNLLTQVQTLHFQICFFFLRIPIFVELKIKKWGALYFRYWLCWQTFRHNQTNIKRLVLSYARISHNAWVVVPGIMFYALCFVHLKI